MNKIVTSFLIRILILLTGSFVDTQIFADVPTILKKSTTEQIFEERYVEWQKFLEEKTPLEIKVKSSFHESLLYDNEPFRKIIEIGVPVLPYIVVKISEDRTLCHALFRITRWRYHIERQGVDPSEYVWFVEEFPELQQRDGPPDRVELWLYWWREGRKQTPQRFNMLHGEWQGLKKKRKIEEAQEKYQRIIDMGIVVLPYLIEKITEGDTALIPAVSKLTDGEVKTDDNPEDCVEWWNKNKEKWYIPIEDEPIEKEEIKEEEKKE